MRRDKEFKKIDEQVEILINKGLTINDKKYAKEVLFRENYFFLNGYRHLLIRSEENKTYLPNATFEELYSIFLFDRSFRNVLFKNILIVENNIKSILSYEMSLQYGYREKDYLNYKNFSNNPNKYRQVVDVIKKIKRQVKSNASSHSATMHYVNNYGYIPLWVLVKVLSFGLIGELFSILKEEDKDKLADIYNLDSNTLNNYLVMLSNYRNICAHEDIVFENKTQRMIDDTQYHRMLNIPITNGEYVYGKNDVFAIIIIMKYMLKQEEFKNLVLEIDRNIQNLAMNLRSIKIEKVLDRMGFPVNWMDLMEYN